MDYKKESIAQRYMRKNLEKVFAEIPEETKIKAMGQTLTVTKKLPRLFNGSVELHIHNEVGDRLFIMSYKFNNNILTHIINTNSNDIYSNMDYIIDLFHIIGFGKAVKKAVKKYYDWILCPELIFGVDQNHDKKMNKNSYIYKTEWHEWRGNNSFELRFFSKYKEKSVEGLLEYLLFGYSADCDEFMKTGKVKRLEK